MLAERHGQLGCWPAQGVCVLLCLSACCFAETDQHFISGVGLLQHNSPFHLCPCSRRAKVTHVAQAQQTGGKRDPAHFQALSGKAATGTQPQQPAAGRYSCAGTQNACTLMHSCTLDASPASMACTPNTLSSQHHASLLDNTNSPATFLTLHRVPPKPPYSLLSGCWTES